MSTPTSAPAQPTVLAQPVVTASRRRPWWVGGAVAFAVFGLGLAVPYVVPDAYTMQLALDWGILAILALSMGFLARHLGLISLGHTAFFGGSAYMVAIATTHWGWGPTQAALLALLVGPLLAVAMGFLVVRATGMGFLMLTLALGQALYQLSVQTAARPITGAFDGLQVRYESDRTFFGMSSVSVVDAGLFWATVWGALVALTFCVWLVGRSRFGTVLEGIRENEERMRFSGYGTFRPRLAAFVFSGFVASVGGVLFAIHGSFVSPEALGFVTAGDALISAIVGGLGTLLGPLLGAALYTYAQANFNVSGNLQLFTGAALVLVLVFLPGGVTGGAKDLWRRLGRTARKDSR